ncbi:MAG: DMT family transporter [Asgard group archaeon]|nr:DMT family transporter [Asgard group archaeon]
MEWLGILEAFGNMIFSGIATVIYKSQGDRIKPGLMLVIQTTVSAIAFQILNASMGNFRRMFDIPLNAFLAFVFAALLGIIIGNFLYLTSLNLIGVSKAYPIAMTYPLLTYIFEIAFLNGTFHWMKFLGIISVILGVSFISISQVNVDINNKENNSDFQELNIEDTERESKRNSKWKLINKINNNKTFLGIILALLTTITWASGTTLIKYGLNQTDVDIIPINSARMIFLVPFALTLYFATRKRNSIKKKITWKSVSLVIVGSLFGLVLANVVYLMALDTVGTSTTAAIAASGPLISTPLSILFLKEKTDWETIKGTILTIIGNVLVVLLVL